MLDTRQSLDKLDGVMETLMSNLQKCAKDHIQACKTDFGFRSKNPGTSTGSVGRVVLQMTETFGPDLKALEGFEQYDESLHAALRNRCDDFSFEEG